MAEPGKPPRDDSAVPPMPQPGGIAARARAAAGAPYLNDLNPEQRLAVETLDGPVLVLAGAGTGKTRVLTTRIAHILATGRARPNEILAVTFTNKAAREMKLRVGTMVGQIVEGMPWLGTFHSIGVKVIRRHAELVGLKPDFTILDVDDQIRLLKQLLAARHRREALACPCARRPDRQLEEPRPHPRPGSAGEAASFAGGKGKKLYVAFQERLSAQRRRFRRPPARMHPAVPRAAEVLRQYQGRFRYILVDEYQDTNVAQHLWLRLLGQNTSPRRHCRP
jgi:DNA helicase-2/ATP-dependent DNA helicase PcrA